MVEKARMGRAWRSGCKFVLATCRTTICEFVVRDFVYESLEEASCGVEKCSSRLSTSPAHLVSGPTAVSKRVAVGLSMNTHHLRLFMLELTSSVHHETIPGSAGLGSPAAYQRTPPWPSDHRESGASSSSRKSSSSTLLKVQLGVRGVVGGELERLGRLAKRAKTRL